MTADTMGASTGPQIRSRVPVANSTSITPGDIGKPVNGAASGGTSNVNDANRAPQPHAVACASETAGSLLFRPRGRPPMQPPRLHRRCNDALLLGSRPSPAPPSRSAISTCVFVIGSPAIHVIRSRPSADDKTRATSSRAGKAVRGSNTSIAFELFSPPFLPDELQGESTQIAARSFCASHVFARSTLRLRTYAQNVILALHLFCISQNLLQRIHGLSGVTLTVIMTIRKSSPSDALRIYHSSIFSFSSLVTSSAPFTCAHPLIPGRADSLIDVFVG